MSRKILCLLVITFLICLSLASSSNIGKWQRYVVSIQNNTYSGNPFELEIEATFTHTSSGTMINLPGYYAGNDTWKIAFMPTLIGEWKYVTSSTDPDLDGVQDSLICVESDHLGMLKRDDTYQGKWKYTDGNYIVPIGLLFSVFLEPGSLAEFSSAADFLKNDVNGHLFNFRLTNLIFSGDWQNHQFDLALWDRLDNRMEVLTERGLGVMIMLYTDDSGEPFWGSQSSTEVLLIRYMVARLASYPVVIFNTGIDISEYRDQNWVDWYGQQIQSLDPYDHPVSSRYGGGSGGYIMSNQTYDSHGAIYAEINELLNFYLGVNIPVGVDDNWGEQFTSRGNFSPSDIRRAFWKCLIAGGIGSHIRDDTKTDFPGANDKDAWFHINNMAAKLDSEQWLRLINTFIENRLGNTFGEMVPTPSLVSNGYCITDLQKTKILYFLMGENDQFDNGNGGPITVKLSNLSGDFGAVWFDPRTGTDSSIGILQGGFDHVLSPPSTDDWVLLLENSNISGLQEGSNIPLDPSLFQNYPNPFNPSTHIKFYLPTSEQITLKIFNTEGQEVNALLNNRKLTEGYHQILFNGSKLASGIYFYQLTSDAIKETRKMVLLK